MPAISKPTIVRDKIVKGIDQLASIPSIDAILIPLMSYVQQPLEDQQLQRVVDLVAHDSALTAQCLRMANSPLFGLRQTITSARAAVMALGLRRMRDIVMSCCLLQLIPDESCGQDPRALWEHMLGVAMTSRKLAQRVGINDSEQMYLAGLLHDLGLVVSLRLIPTEISGVMRRAITERRAIACIEQEILGLTHCDTGFMLAQEWKLSPIIQDVIRFHHHQPQSSNHRAAVALVNICDRICRGCGLGHGYDEEEPPIDWNLDEFVAVLRSERTIAQSLDWERCGCELVKYTQEIQKLVGVLFRFS